MCLLYVCIDLFSRAGEFRIGERRLWVSSDGNRECDIDYDDACYQGSRTGMRLLGCLDAEGLQQS